LPQPKCPFRITLSPSLNSISSPAWSHRVKPIGDGLSSPLFTTLFIQWVSCFCRVQRQSIEHLAAGLSHESNYYWSAFVLIIIVTANFRQDLINYLLLFSGLLLIRWVMVGSVRALFGCNN